jgi:hypothetical protein
LILISNFDLPSPLRDGSAKVNATEMAKKREAQRTLFIMAVSPKQRIVPKTRRERGEFRSNRAPELDEVAGTLLNSSYPCHTCQPNSAGVFFKNTAAYVDKSRAGVDNLAS